MSLRPLAFLLLVAAQSAPREKTAKAPPEVGATVQIAPGSEISGPWQTFVVELENKTTRDLDVVVHIEDESYSGFARRRDRLSPSARKRLFLYSAGSIYARQMQPRWRITDPSDRILAEGFVSINARGYVNNPYQVGLFSRTSAAADDFGIPSGLSGQEIRFGKLTTATFPDRWIGLFALDLLIISDAALDELTADQARALSEYVRLGGTVVLSPGVTKGWLGHPVLSAFAAIRTGEPQPVTQLPHLNSAHGRFRNNVEAFLVHPILNGAPYKEQRYGREIVQFNAGFGRVLVLGFDVLRAPFDTWNGRRGLWTELLSSSPRWFQEERSAFPNASTPQQRLDLFQQMARLINPYPSFGLILGLAALFLAAVGPLNYAVLWRLRRTILLVVTIPSISIAFLVLVLGLGYWLKGTTTVVHSARLLSTRSGLDCARETQLFSLFSPSTRTYDVACEPGTFGEPPWRWGLVDYRYNQRGAIGMGALTVETGAGLTLRGLNTGQWQSWDLEARAIRDLGQGVRFDASGPAIRISNGSARHIERGVYVMIDREPLVVPFGEIAAGKTGESRSDVTRADPLQALGLAPDTLGDRLLRAWFDTMLRRPRPYETTTEDKRKQFLICVLREEGEPVRVDARVSDRSRSITLLHVGEAP